MEQYAATADAVLTPENRFLAAFATGTNVFLTGMGGTGKSTLLQKALDLKLRCMDRLCGTETRVVLTAPTGVAALNIGGCTLHRFFALGSGPDVGESCDEFMMRWSTSRPYTFARTRIKNCDTLVIDEISMLPGRVLDMIDYLCRKLRDGDKPFGGIHMVVIGDFLQLPPVRLSETENYDWAFKTEAWKNGGFTNINLVEPRRQSEPNFIRALKEFREGRCFGANAELFQNRIVNFPDSSLTRLCTHNAQVDKWNACMLESLSGDNRLLVGQYNNGDDYQIGYLRKFLLTPENLNLKPKAMVMFTANHPEQKYFNGMTGIVEEVGEDEIVISPVNGGPAISVERHKWYYDARLKAGATFEQFPLRLAWAMTIHKAQGVSLDSAYIDIRAAREPGQAYVAVSRVRTLGGLFFKDWFKGIHVSIDAIEFYRNLL
jgi:hypothetical protein